MPVVPEPANEQRHVQRLENPQENVGMVASGFSYSIDILAACFITRILMLWSMLFWLLFRPHVATRREQVVFLCPSRYLPPSVFKMTTYFRGGALGGLDGLVLSLQNTKFTRFN